MSPDHRAGANTCPRFDHHDASLLGDELYNIYRDLREQPVAWSDLHGGFWIVSRHDDVRAVLKDHETFASGQGCFLPVTPGFRSLGLESDPPEHGKFRKLFLGLAGRAAVEASEPLLRRMTRRVVGEFAALGGGDAVSEISEKLPVEGIALMCGLSAQTAAQVREMTVEMWKRMSEDPSAVAPLMRLLLGEVAARRGHGRSDYLTSLADAEIDGRPLTEDELGNVLLSAVVAGHETTMNASSNLMLELAKAPDLQRRLREDAGLVPHVVEEALRHRAPVHLFFRTVTRDATFAGTAMRAGDKVAVLYASANRDPDRFEDADVFDPHRDDLGHLTFGWGIHRCVGAPLAQAELRMLCEELLRHGRFVLDGTPEPSSLEGGHHMGWRRLPIAFTAA
jgi:cytochrome P450